MAILKFEPIFKSPIWGGNKIIPYKGVESDLNTVGESWEISGVKGDESIIANGEHKGKSLAWLVGEMKSDLVGKSNYERFGDEFPLLIKFIDAQQDLSIQVHPNDELSKKRHDKCGKTEMWYIIDADKGAKLRAGFAEKITPEQYEEHIKNDTITNVLKEYDIAAGDLFFLPAGRIHSIGAGSLIAEIQQTSDVTYRIYDFNRKDDNGNGRELHTELSKKAIDYETLPDYRTNYVSMKDREVELISCKYFTTSLYDLDNDMQCDYRKLDSFVIMICVEGEGLVVTNDNQSVSIRQGETILLPATTTGATIKPNIGIKMLISYI